MLLLLSLLLFIMMIIRGGYVESNYIFPIEEKNKEGNTIIVNYFIMHQESVTVEEVIQRGRELGCIG